MIGMSINTGYTKLNSLVFLAIESGISGAFAALKMFKDHHPMCLFNYHLSVVVGLTVGIGHQCLTRQVVSRIGIKT